MRTLLSIFVFASITAFTATAVSELSAPDNSKPPVFPTASAGNVGSWKDFVPNVSGWIEVDPATGKPLIKDAPPMTNLKAKPQMPAAEADG